jgi:hypothetical protein
VGFVWIIAGFLDSGLGLYGAAGGLPGLALAAIGLQPKSNRPPRRTKLSETIAVAIYALLVGAIVLVDESAAVIFFVATMVAAIAGQTVSLVRAHLSV